MPSDTVDHARWMEAQRFSNSNSIHMYIVFINYLINLHYLGKSALVLKLCFDFLLWKAPPPTTFPRSLRPPTNNYFKRVYLSSFMPPVNATKAQRNSYRMHAEWINCIEVDHTTANRSCIFAYSPWKLKVLL